MKYPISSMLSQWISGTSAGNSQAAWFLWTCAHLVPTIPMRPSWWETEQVDESFCFSRMICWGRFSNFGYLMLMLMAVYISFRWNYVIEQAIHDSMHWNDWNRVSQELFNSETWYSFFQQQKYSFMSLFSQVVYYQLFVPLRGIGTYLPKIYGAQWQKTARLSPRIFPLQLPGAIFAA